MITQNGGLHNTLATNGTTNETSRKTFRKITMRLPAYFNIIHLLTGACISRYWMVNCHKLDSQEGTPGNRNKTGYSYSYEWYCPSKTGRDVGGDIIELLAYREYRAIFTYNLQQLQFGNGR